MLPITLSKARELLRAAPLLSPLIESPAWLIQDAKAAGRRMYLGSHVPGAGSAEEPLLAQAYPLPDCITCYGTTAKMLKLICWPI